MAGWRGVRPARRTKAALRRKVALWHCGIVAFWHCGILALWHDATGAGAPGGWGEFGIVPEKTT